MTLDQRTPEWFMQPSLQWTGRTAPDRQPRTGRNTRRIVQGRSP